MSILAYVGLDVHKEMISVHVIPDGPGLNPIRKELVNDRVSVKKYFSKLAEKYTLYCCYEASGCGYVLHRWLKEINVDCIIIAPSLVPKRSGDRVKTDRRDAEWLARMLRADELTPVNIPTSEEEADRRVLRLRHTMVREVVMAKNYLLKFLLLNGRRYEGKSNWTKAHWAYLEELRFDGTDTFVYDEYFTLLKDKVAKLAKIDAFVQSLAQTDLYKERVQRMCCLRGIATLTAMVLITEVGDFRRFGSARQLMSYFGLVPSEYSSGERQKKGSITKTGNSRCRGAIVEAAWKYMKPAGPSAALKLRQKDAPEDVVGHANKAQVRLHGKYWSIAVKKGPRKAVVATARELVGFVWGIMTGNCTDNNMSGHAERVSAALAAA